MAIHTKKDIDSFDRHFRLHLMNSISGIKSANLVGTKDQFSNLAVISSVIHLGSHPATFGFVLRPITGRRDTYDNIKSSGYFTINSITSDFVEQAHYTSGKFSPEENEFNIVNLTEEYLNNFYAPFCKESPIKIGLKLVEELSISNGCKLMVGQVELLSINDEIIEESGKLSLSDANLVGVNGLNRYHPLQDYKEFPFVGNGAVPDFKQEK